MSTINWIPQLQPHEWPDGVVDQMNHDLFNRAVIPLRLACGVPFTPSPLLAGHIRKKGDSRHSIKQGQRLSDATDIFIPSKDTATVFREALRIPDIGGFGVYFDTKPSVMIHIDTRPERLVWIRVEGHYIYEVNDPVFFYAELSKQLRGIYGRSNN